MFSIWPATGEGSARPTMHDRTPSLVDQRFPARSISHGAPMAERTIAPSIQSRAASLASRRQPAPSVSGRSLSAARSRRHSGISMPSTTAHSRVSSCGASSTWTEFKPENNVRGRPDVRDIPDCRNSPDCRDNHPCPWCIPTMPPASLQTVRVGHPFVSSPYSQPTPHFAPPSTYHGPMYERSTNLFEAARYARAYQESINIEPAELEGTNSQQPVLPNDYVKPEPQTEEPQIKTIELSALHEVFFLAVILAAQFMAAAGLGQATAPGSIIGRSLSVASSSQQMWFTAAYAMTTGTFILIASRIGDILGHKRIFIFGYLWLGVWSGFAGCTAYIGRQAPFDFCRGMQGIGSAMLIAGAFSLLDRAHHPGMKKKMILTLFGAMVPCGLVFGAVFASIFAQCAWWPWAFWSFAIASWTLCALALLVIPEVLAHNAQFFDLEDKPSMDWTGSLLGLVGLMLVAIGLNNAPVFGWQKPHVVFLLVVGLISFTVFFWIESRDLYPLVPVKSLNLTVLWILVILALGWASFGIWLVYSCRYLIELRSQTSIAVAAGLIPLFLLGIIAAAVVVYMVQHQHLSFALLVAMLSFLVSEIIAAAQPMHQSYWAQTFISTLIMPFGLVLSFPTSIILLSDSLPPEYRDLAPALINTVIFYAISLALGIGGSVEVQVSLNKIDITDVKYGILCAKYTGVALAGFGLILGALFFGKRVIKDGWLANR